MPQCGALRVYSFTWQLELYGVGLASLSFDLSLEGHAKMSGMFIIFTYQGIFGQARKSRKNCMCAS